MLEYYQQRPGLALLLFALVILTLFVWFMAARASAKRSKENRNIMEKIKKENTIRNKYAILTSSLIGDAPEEELFMGVGLNLQKRVADKEDMAGEFDSLTAPQKHIYCLYTFVEDATEKASDFFANNTAPLTTTALEGARVLFEKEIADDLEHLFNAYDDNNEIVSCIPEEIGKINKKMAPFITEGTIDSICGKYIKENAESFIK